MKYNTEEIEINDAPRYGIRLDNFKDVLFILGSVSLEEENEHLRIRYNYEILEGTVNDPSNFEKSVGDFICFCITNKNDQFAYFGGK